MINEDDVVVECANCNNFISTNYNIQVTCPYCFYTIIIEDSLVDDEVEELIEISLAMKERINNIVH